MLTWRLWRGLNRSAPLTAVYQRLNLRRESVAPAALSLPALNILLNLLSVVLPIAVIFLGVPFLFVTFFLLFPYTRALIVLATSGYGLLLCMPVSAQIAHEHEKGLYDLLSVWPPGRLGLHWAYVKNGRLAHPMAHYLLIGFLGIGAFIVVLGYSADLLEPFMSSPNKPGWVVAWVVGTGATMMSIWLEYIQTTLVGSLIAMITGALVRQSTTARLCAAGAFLTLQLALFLLTGALTQPLQQSLLGLDGELSVIYHIGTPVLALIVAVALRESVIRGLWRLVVRTLNASPSELDAITHNGL